MNDEKFTIEQTQELYEFLKGKTPEGFTFKTGQPTLSEDTAFTIIYVLQEKFHMIPDTYEKCVRCKEIFDMEWGGNHYEDPGINLCDSCEDYVRYRWEGVKEWYADFLTKADQNEM